MTTSDNASPDDAAAAGNPRVARLNRYYGLLLEVYERGPHGIGAAELDELARQFGYDRRGLNGCFAGTRAPLRRENGRVHLTLAGQSAVTARLHAEASA